MNTPSTNQLDRMASTIADGGIDSIPVTTLRRLAFEAHREGVSASVAYAIVDTTLPMVLRQRAFGHIAVKLAKARARRSHFETTRAA